MIKLYKILVLALLFLSPGISYGAQVELQSLDPSLSPGEVFVVDLKLNTEGESINALEGKVLYDPLYFEVLAFDVSKSFISFWLENPAVSALGTVVFSGVAPGGISARDTNIFSFTLRTKQKGNTDIKLKDVNLYINDGAGTLAKTTVKNEALSISGELNEQSVVASDDKTPPETFKITRERSALAFDDKLFIAFSSIDKGSGIASYNICELFSCVKGENPHVLRNQTPFYYIKVVAIDHAGNTRSSSIISPYIFIALSVLVILFTYLYRRYLVKGRI